MSTDFSSYIQDPSGSFQVGDYAIILEVFGSFIAGDYAEIINIASDGSPQLKRTSDSYQVYANVQSHPRGVKWEKIIPAPTTTLAPTTTPAPTTTASPLSTLDDYKEIRDNLLSALKELSKVTINQYSVQERQVIHERRSEIRRELQSYERKIALLSGKAKGRRSPSLEDFGQRDRVSS